MMAVACLKFQTTIQSR